MINKTLILLITLFSFNSVWSNEAVHDSTLNLLIKANHSTNVAKQLEQLQQTTQIATQTANLVKNAIDIKNNSLASLIALTGNMLFSKALDPIFDDVISGINESYSLEEKIIGGRKITPNNINDINILYRDLYGNNFRERELKKPLVKKHVSDSMQDALLYAEFMIVSSKKRLEEINKTAIQSDNANSIKESADLGNKILSLMSISMEETKLMNAKYSRYQLLKNYDGISNLKTIKKEKTEFERIKNKEGSVFSKKSKLPREDGERSFWDR
jgi:hypothetical protein